MDGRSILIWIVIGLVAGLLASMVVGGGAGLLWYLVIGLLGSVVGGWLAGNFGLKINLGNPILEQIVISFIGAIVLLLILRLIFRI